jgi:hypothetical protein
LDDLIFARRRGHVHKRKRNRDRCVLNFLFDLCTCAYMHVAACGAGQSGNACRNLASYPRKIYFQLSTPKMDMHGTPPGVLPTRSYSVLTWFRNG